MLDNYEKYQKVWVNQLKGIQNARDRINIKGLNPNYKMNSEQAFTDITLQDRDDYYLLEKKNITEVLGNAFGPVSSYLNW
jgi:hypothetical protein